MRRATHAASGVGFIVRCTSVRGARALLSPRTELRAYTRQRRARSPALAPLEFVRQEPRAALRKLPSFVLAQDTRPAAVRARRARRVLGRPHSCIRRSMARCATVSTCARPQPLAGPETAARDDALAPALVRGRPAPCRLRDRQLRRHRPQARRAARRGSRRRGASRRRRALSAARAPTPSRAQTLRAIAEPTCVHRTAVRRTLEPRKNVAATFRAFSLLKAAGCAARPSAGAGGARGWQMPALAAASPAPTATGTAPGLRAGCAPARALRAGRPGARALPLRGLRMPALEARACGARSWSRRTPEMREAAGPRGVWCRRPSRDSRRHLHARPRRAAHSGRRTPHFRWDQGARQLATLLGALPD